MPFAPREVLLVLSANFQLGDRARVLVTFQLFAVFGVLTIVVHFDIAAMLLGTALQNFAILFQFVAIEVDDFGGGVVGNIVGDYQFHSESFGQQPQIRLVLIVVS